MSVGKPGRPAIGPAVIVRLPEDLIARLDELSHEHGLTRAELVRRILASYVRSH